MRCREATKKDSTQLLNLIKAYKRELTLFVPKKLQKYRVSKKSDEEIEKELYKMLTDKKSLCLLIEQNNVLIGFSYSLIKEKKHLVFKSFYYGFIDQIYIQKKYRGNKLSKQLIDKSIDWFKNNNCEYSALTVLSKNPAKDIYKKWGFETYMDSMIKN